MTPGWREPEIRAGTEIDMGIKLGLAVVDGGDESLDLARRYFLCQY